METETVSRQIAYGLLAKQAEALLSGESDAIANMANLSALLYESLAGINWTGFYRLIGDELVLGPFQGRPACVRIAVGKGVCGTAAQKGKSIIVPNVHQFPGHIACDAASQCEIVIPVIKNGRTLGVLDIDSPQKNRFNEEDRKGLETIVQIYLDKTRIE